MTKLSVNVNKIATLRNARGSNTPDLESVTASIIRFGSDGITIHPRPDERHIKYSDIFPISNLTKDKVEFNIEGFPSEKFLKKAVKLGLSMDHDLAMAKLQLAGIAMTKRRKREATTLMAEAKKLDKHGMLKEQMQMMKQQMKKI